MGNTRKSVVSGNCTRVSSCPSFRARLTGVGAVASAGILVLGLLAAPSDVHGGEQNEVAAVRLAAVAQFQAAPSTMLMDLVDRSQVGTVVPITAVLGVDRDGIPSTRRTSTAGVTNSVEFNSLDRPGNGRGPRLGRYPAAAAQHSYRWCGRWYNPVVRSGDPARCPGMSTLCGLQRRQWSDPKHSHRFDTTTGSRHGVRRNGRTTAGHCPDVDERRAAERFCAGCHRRGGTSRCVTDRRNRRDEFLDDGRHC